MIGVEVDALGGWHPRHASAEPAPKKARTMLILAGTIDVHPDDLAAFLSSAKLVTQQRAEPRNIAYAVLTRDLDAHRLRLFEAWQDRAALDAHLDWPHISSPIVERIANSSRVTWRLTRGRPQAVLSDDHASMRLRVE